MTKRILSIFSLCFALLLAVAPAYAQMLTVIVAGQGGSSVPPVSCGSFAHCRPGVIDHTKVPNTDQVDFPVLLSATESDWAVSGSGGDVLHTVTQTGGAPILIPADFIVSTDSCVTPVTGGEFEKYVSTTGQVILHFNPGTLSHTVDTPVTICVGKSSLTTQQMTVSTTWNSAFTRVQHFPDGTTLTANGSAGGGCSGVLINSPTAVAGQVDGAAHFVAASSQSISLNPCAMPAPPFTISAWVKIAGGSFSTIVGNASTPGTAQYRIENDNKQALLAQGVALVGSSTTALTTGVWHHVAVTYDSVNARFYLDGIADGAPASSQSISTGTDTVIGSNASEFFDGDIDEFKVSTTVRSADWLKTEVNNQSSPSTFLTIGARL